MARVFVAPTLEKLLVIAAHRHPEMTSEQQLTLAQKALAIYSEPQYAKFHIKRHLLIKIAYARTLIPSKT